MHAAPCHDPTVHGKTSGIEAYRKVNAHTYAWFNSVAMSVELLRGSRTAMLSDVMVRRRQARHPLTPGAWSRRNAHYADTILRSAPGDGRAAWSDTKQRIALFYRLVSQPPTAIIPTGCRLAGGVCVTLAARSARCCMTISSARLGRRSTSSNVIN